MAEDTHKTDRPDPGLYVVATPIGNLGDITRRAVDVLAAADVIAAEDTRRTGTLLNHLGISTRPTAFHAHNEQAREGQLLEWLAAGKIVALVSDAGTPLLADPGFSLVRAARNAGLPVFPVPGASALLAALSVSGLPTHRFIFEGFVPAKKKARTEFYQAVAASTATTVCFEVPHRLRASLESFREAAGDDRVLVVCRELTKTYEQVFAGGAADVLAAVESGAVPERGELVLVIAGAEAEAAGAVADDNLLQVLLDELSPSRAAAAVSRLTGMPKKAAYDRALQLLEKREARE